MYAPQTKFQKGVVFFGAISADCKYELVLCSHGVEAPVLASNILQSGIVEKMDTRYVLKRWLFIQDGAHTARAAVWELERHVVFLGGWLPASCDLNPIKQISSIIKRRLQSGMYAELALAARVERLWHDIPQDTCQRLAESFPARCQMRLNGQTISQFLSSHKTPQPAAEPVNLPFTEAGDEMIIRICEATGNRWAAAARQLANEGLELSRHDVKRRYLFLTEMAHIDMRLQHQPLPGIETLPMPEWAQ